MTNTGKKKGKNDKIIGRLYSSTDLAEQESQLCDIIDEFRKYEHAVAEEDFLVPALAMRCYHLPGYTKFEDWIQYFKNNHPILSLCCHHAQHPIGFRVRLLLLAGSIVFGLAVTNIIWLWFYYNGSDQNEPAVTLKFGSDSSSSVSSQYSAAAADSSESSEFAITQGMVMLWTVGGLLHAVFDNTVWYISACVCCLSSQKLDTYRKWGTYLIVVTVVLVTAIASFAVVLRTSAEEAQGNDGQAQLSIHKDSIYRLFISYATEFALALLVYYPLIATLLFSGILGCGSIPILGGRPYEVKLEEKRRARWERHPSSDVPPFEIPSLTSSSGDIEQATSRPPVRNSQRR